MELEKENKFHEDTITVQREKIAGDIQEAKINALGRASDRQSDVEGMNIILKQGEIALQQQVALQNDENEKTRIKNDLEIAMRNVNNKAQEIQLQQEKLNVEREKISAMKYKSDNDKFNSIINKN